MKWEQYSRLTMDQRQYYKEYKEPLESRPAILNTLTVAGGLFFFLITINTCFIMWLNHSEVSLEIQTQVVEGIGATMTLIGYLVWMVVILYIIETIFWGYILYKNNKWVQEQIKNNESEVTNGLRL